MAELPARRRIRERLEAEARMKEANDTKQTAGASSAAAASERNSANSVGADANQTKDLFSWDKDAWKSFDLDTPAGVQLRKLYGHSSKPVIKYPKLKVKKPEGDDGSRPFMAGGLQPDTFQPSDATRRRRVEAREKFVAPRVGVGGPHRGVPRAPVDMIPSKKKESVIAAELDVITMRMEHYRPPYIKPRATAEEKARLQDTFAYKGGRALPEELTEMRRDVAPAEPRGGRGKKLPPRRQTSDESSAKTPTELMFEQVAVEVEERREFLERARATGLGDKYEAQLAGEISLRCAEMERLNRRIQDEEERAKRRQQLQSELNNGS